MRPGELHTEARGSQEGTDDEDPDIEDANAKKLRAIARRQAYAKKKEVSLSRWMSTKLAENLRAYYGVW